MKSPPGRKELANITGLILAIAIVIPQLIVVAMPTPLGGRTSEVYIQVVGPIED